MTKFKDLKRILICEDHPLVQMGLDIVLKNLLPHAELTIVGNGARALAEIIDRDFDLILMDLGLPDISGTELIEKIKKVKPSVKILVVTSCDQPAVLGKVMALGVAGIMQKATSVEHLSRALLWVEESANKPFLDAEVSALLQEVHSCDFTQKELLILAEIVKGSTNQEIADELNCSIFSVRFHRANILSKAGVRNAAELTARHLQNKLF